MEISVMNREIITTTIEKLSDKLIKNWPLYSFVTSNPLHGFQDLHFEEAIDRIRSYMGIKGYPSASLFQQAWDNGQIDEKIIEAQLEKKGISKSPPKSLKQLHRLEHRNYSEKLLGPVDRQVIKWLSVFMDEGTTQWGMPNREEGFFKAWRSVAAFDLQLPRHNSLDDLPEDALLTLQQLLEDQRPDDLYALFKHHLLALPGWTGYIKYRSEENNEWQQIYPITLTDYLAVRLAICSLLDKDLLPEHHTQDSQQRREEQLKVAWLEALEYSYQNRLINQVVSQGDLSLTGQGKTPDAQFVFCIDTRSERIRRAVEKVGNYETFGYAGFFGVAMDYIHPEKEITHKACPPIVESAYEAREQVQPQHKEEAQTYDFFNSLLKALNEFRFTLKNNIPASFGYVESAGFFYGVGLVVKTLIPNFVYKFGNRALDWMGTPEQFSTVKLNTKTDDHSSGTDTIPTPEKVEIAKNAFELMGWSRFAPLVVFAGHGSQTANNPFGSSLDCGACAGNKGRHNARILADICNEREVRELLAEKYDIQIPEDTWFLGAEHNTTTNEIVLYDRKVPQEYHDEIQRLKNNLSAARQQANREQFTFHTESSNSLEREAHRRAADWAETRPEWGLAGNASFIIGPRRLTTDLDLEARSFLHSYNWKNDPEGEKLKAILLGPMVVTQWINNHYYFTTVDNVHFGSGTKITQNVTGAYGVVQGNGGDLQAGLPLESLQEDDYRYQHIPQRLTVLIHAPKDRVESIIEMHPESLGNLVENEWIYVAVIDPEDDNSVSFMGEKQPESLHAFQS